MKIFENSVCVGETKSGKVIRIVENTDKKFTVYQDEKPYETNIASLARAKDIFSEYFVI